MSAASKPLNLAGKAFFGSLCAGTFGLGVWQSIRYFEKVDLVQKRQDEMNMPPIPLEPHSMMSRSEFRKLRNSSSSSPKSSNDVDDDEEEVGFRRVYTRGIFRHEHEVLVGPRGPPLDTLGNKGPLSGRSSGGMGVSPQGYFVYTPLDRVNQEGTILVNRGWIPMSYEKQNIPFDRPSHIVDVVGVTTEAEQPRFFSPPHPSPPKLLWLERSVLEQRTHTHGLSPLIVTETTTTTSTSDDPHNNLNNNKQQSQEEMTFPVKSIDTTVGEFKVLPETHAGYAVTWFGLSGAGVIMMRKMLTRGR